MFLGIDVGATKTHALVCDEQGLLLGFGNGPGGNPETEGYTGLAQAMQTAWQEASRQAGIGKEQIEAAGFGIAGYDWPFQYMQTLESVKILGLSSERLRIENDAVPPIYAGTTHGWGIAACVGTGNNVRGLDAQGRSARITGNSSAFGEFGGAAEIMQVVLQRLAWMWTGRGKATQLADILVQDCGASSLGDLIEGLVAGRYELKACQAPLVVQAAQTGDAVAEQVLIWNAQELAQSVLAVAAQLDLTSQPFEVVMSGHLFAACDRYRQAFSELVLSSAQQADFRLFSAPPVVGAVLMAMKACGLDLKKPRKTILASFQDSMQ